MRCRHPSVPRSMLLEESGAPCLDVSYAVMVEQLQNTTWVSNVVGGRMWVYQVVPYPAPCCADVCQTCVEFGYFQTSDSSQQPFGDLFPLALSTQVGCAVASVPALTAADVHRHLWPAGPQCELHKHLLRRLQHWRQPHRHAERVRICTCTPLLTLKGRLTRGTRCPCSTRPIPASRQSSSRARPTAPTCCRPARPTRPASWLPARRSRPSSTCGCTPRSTFAMLLLAVLALAAGARALGLQFRPAEGFTGRVIRDYEEALRTANATLPADQWSGGCDQAALGQRAQVHAEAESLRPQ